MTETPTFVAENRSGLEVLIYTVRGLSEAQLCAPMEAGWTVSGVLMHLAFWDLRALTLVQKWEKEGAGPSPMDIDVVNEAMRRLLNAVSPQAAVEMVLDSAALVADEISRLSPEQLADFEANGPSLHLNRANHWRTHLDEINQRLGLAS